MASTLERSSGDWNFFLRKCDLRACVLPELSSPPATDNDGDDDDDDGGGGNDGAEASTI